MSEHKVIIVTKDAKRLAVIDVIFANKVSWVNECKSVASQWLRDNDMQLASYFPAMGNLTVWVQ